MGMQVVTVIEMLSPSDNMPVTGGRRTLPNSRKSGSSAHLVEIDLLATARTRWLLPKRMSLGGSHPTT